jgi:uncharacterized protein (TIGR02145 family)
MLSASRISLNLGWVLSSWLILFVAYFMRIGLHPFVDTTVYVTLGSIATVFLLLPEWLASRERTTSNWTHTSEFYSLIVIVSVCGLGLLAGNGTIGDWIARGLWALAAGLTVWAVYRAGLSLRVLTLLASATLGALFALDLYHTEGVTPHFYERMILGSAFIDTLGHAAISKMFATHWVSSVGLDGLVTFKYHWGSHALLGGIINLASTDAIAGYILAFPAIFLVFLFKSTVDFVSRIGEYYGQRVSALGVVMVLFMILLVQLFVTRPYLWMESTTVANVFMFLFLGIILTYAKQHKALDYGIVVFSVVMLVALSVLKISHGFVLVCGLGYATLRAYPSIRTLGILVLGGLVVFLVVLGYVLLIAETMTTGLDLSLNALIYYVGQRFKVFWSYTGLPWAYISGVMIAIAVWMLRGYLSSVGAFFNAVREKSTIELEALVVVNLSGFAGALYVSEHSLDVFFFLSVQLILSLCYVMYLVVRPLTGVPVTRWVVLAGVQLVLGVGASTKTNLMDLPVRKKEYISAMDARTTAQTNVLELMADLKRLPSEFDPKETAVYIAKDQDWYYGSQLNMLGAPFIVPSMSGFVSVGGISEVVWYSSTIRYGYDEYRLLRDGLIYETSEAMAAALEYGFQQLVVYRVEDQKLIREVITKDWEPRAGSSSSLMGLVVSEEDSTLIRTVLDQDGSENVARLIGAQWWFVNNLRVRTYANGDPIEFITDAQDWSKTSVGAVSVYDNDEALAQEHGYLYNWNAVVDPRGLCPAGWRVPSDDDWVELERFLGMEELDLYDAGSRGGMLNIGGMLKDTSDGTWIYPNRGAVNSTGFSGRGSGSRLFTGGYTGMDRVGFWWTSTPRISGGLYQNRVWVRFLSHHSPYVSRISTFKQSGLSVRCLK